MAKKRVHEIAKEQNLSSKELLEKLQAAGIEVKAAASTVEEADALRALTNGAPPAAAVASAPAPVAPRATPARPAAAATPAAPARRVFEPDSGPTPTTPVRRVFEPRIVSKQAFHDLGRDRAQRQRCVER